MALTILLPPTTLPAKAVTGSGDRTLSLHHTHTGQTQTFTFKRNGNYDKAVLKQMNVFLADWRTKEPANMDPALFDLLWQIYKAVDGKQPINIVSSYRSPKTNKMLRSKSSGVAENSQHMKGKAMDVFIPGVNLSKLREAAMKFQVGGVGYYPTSGSPFVHVDTGSVRAWPRMTRAQLKKVFPDGKTLHLPTDGKPLSHEGRAYAQAQWTKCHAVPCNGAVTFETDPGIMIADATGDVTPIPGADAAPIPLMKPAGLYGDAKVLVASVEEDPAQRLVSTFEIAAPIPIERPGDVALASGGDYSEWEKLGAPVPAVKSQRIRLATRSTMGAADGQTALAALDAIDPMPKPRVLMTPEDGLAGGEMVTAYVPTNQDPGAELALKMIIERETAELPALPQKLDRLAVPDEIRTASLGEGDQLTGIFDQTFNALDGTATSQPMKSALAELVQSRLPNQSIAGRAAELFAPEIDHVNETLVQPVMMTDGFWAVLSEAEGYLDKGTELGPLTGRIDFIPDNAAIPAYDRFVMGTPQLVAGL